VRPGGGGERGEGEGLLRVRQGGGHVGSRDRRAGVRTRPAVEIVAPQSSPQQLRKLRRPLPCGAASLNTRASRPHRCEWAFDRQGDGGRRVEAILLLALCLVPSVPNARIVALAARPSHAAQHAPSPPLPTPPPPPPIHAQPLVHSPAEVLAAGSQSPIRAITRGQWGDADPATVTMADVATGRSPATKPKVGPGWGGGCWRTRPAGTHTPPPSHLPQRR
jgi:hypothetical protein